MQWHQENFTLTEIYHDDWARKPEQEAPKPNSQKRTANFHYNDDPLLQHASVTQELHHNNEIFSVLIEKKDSTTPCLQ